MDVALVTGANSGIGRATAIRLAAGGFTVYGGMRDLASGEKLAAMAGSTGVEVRPVRVDVTDEDSVRAAVARIADEAGGVDALVNNAGISANGTVEDAPAGDFQRAFDVNVCGIVRCASAVLPGMRERRHGAIVNVSSIAGRVAMGAQAPYVTSKWAVEGLTEGLAYEVAPHGIRVALVEPGVTKSAIFRKSEELPPTTGAYEAAYRRMFQFFATGLKNVSPAEVVAETIHEALTTDKPVLRYTCSWAAAELGAGRAAMADEDWVALGGLASDEEFYREFSRLFGLDIAPEDVPGRAPEGAPEGAVDRAAEPA